MSLYPIPKEASHVLSWENWSPLGWVKPFSWSRHLRRDGEERSPAHRDACDLLAEIVFWHKPVATFDDNGKPTGLRKRFMGDEWQVNYPALAEKLSMNESVLRKAVAYLEEKGLITRTVRTTRTETGAFVRYVTIKANFSAIQAITHFDDNGVSPSKARRGGVSLEGEHRRLPRRACSPSKGDLSKVRTEATDRKGSSLPRPADAGSRVDSANAPLQGWIGSDMPADMMEANNPSEEEHVLAEARRMPAAAPEDMEDPAEGLKALSVVVRPIRTRLDDHLEQRLSRRAILPLAWKYFTGEIPNERDIKLCFNAGQSQQELLFLIAQVGYLKSEHSRTEHNAPRARKCRFLGQLIREFDVLRKEAVACFPELYEAIQEAAFVA